MTDFLEPPKGGQFRHCGLCHFSAPVAEYNNHDCRPEAVKRHMAQIAAQQRRAEEARNGPQPCPDCPGTYVPGKVHYCRPAPSAVDVATAQAAAGLEASHIADVLRRSGYSVTKDTPA